jgi:translation initiation factor IF-3
VGRCGLLVADSGGGTPISTTEPRINERIRAARCRLIGAEGEQLGIFNLPDAMRVADELALDLVEIAPSADPPVCRIMDYSKFRYEQAIKAKKARKHQTTVQIKEIKFRPKIDKHDYETKKRHVVRFLESGAKVKVTIMFRGREMVHAERGLAILERLAEDVKDLCTVESQPKLEGRNMLMLLAPVKKEPVKGEKHATDEKPTAEAVETEADESAEADAVVDEVETTDAE